MAKKSTARPNTVPTSTIEEGSGSFDSSPLFGAADVQFLRQGLYNPLRGFTPAKLVTWLENFESGFIGDAVRAWHRMAKGDLMIHAVKGKREDAVAQRSWKIMTADHVEGDASLEKEAEAQAERRRYFWNNIRVVNALDRNDVGGFSKFVRMVMEAESFHYAPMHFIWHPSPKGLTATIEFLPGWLFENTAGEMRFLGTQPSAVYGLPMDPTNWHVAVGRGIMFAGSIGYGYKHMALSANMRFLARYGMPFPLGKLINGTKGSAEGKAMEATIKAINNDGGAVIYGNGEVELLQANASGTDSFAAAIERIDRWFSCAYRGGDLSTISSKEGVGASQQSKETLLTEAADCQRVSEVMQAIEARLDTWADGEGVEALAYSCIDAPSMDDIEAEIRVDEFLVKNGVKMSLSGRAEYYGRALAEDGQDVFGPAAEAQVNIKTKTPGKGEQTAKQEPSVNAAMTAPLRAAMMQDLQPLREAIATVLQNNGMPLTEEQWAAVIESVLNGKAIEAALNETFFMALLREGGTADADIASLIAEVTAQTPIITDL